MKGGGLIRGRPVKRDEQASNGSVTLTFQNNGHVNGDHVTVIKSSVKTTKVVQESATTTIDVIDIDDLPDVDEDIDMDAKRKKTPRRAAAITKKQKTTEVLSATTREVKTQRVSAPKPAKKAPAAAKAKVDVRETSKAASEVVSEDSAMQDDVSNAAAAAAPMKTDLGAHKEREEVPCNLVTSTRIPTDIAHTDYPHRYVKVCVGGSVSCRSVLYNLVRRMCWVSPVWERVFFFCWWVLSIWNFCRVHRLIRRSVLLLQIDKRSKKDRLVSMMYSVLCALLITIRQSSLSWFSFRRAFDVKFYLFEILWSSR